MSTTFDAVSVTVQVSLFTKDAIGVSVKDVGPPVCAAVCARLVVQLIAYQPLATVTGSVKVMTIIEFTATPLAPFTGFVDATDGGTSPPQTKTGVDELRGDGAPTAKSALLRSVSTQPLPRRRSDVVLL